MLPTTLEKSQENKQSFSTNNQSLRSDELKQSLRSDELKQSFSTNNWNYYWDLGLNTVRQLQTDKGILASGQDEIYGAIFGRDSLITSLKLLQVYQKTHLPELLPIVKKVLTTLVELQGKAVNIQSGEEPGKCIHEYRPTGHEHLTQALSNPWYIYSDQIMRNYDTIDATPLLLIALYRYSQASGDQEFILKVLPNIYASLNWIFDYGDSNQDGLLDYGPKVGREYGGLTNQNWMDSTESTFHEDGAAVTFPIAPLEAQAYTYLALKLWGNYFKKTDQTLSKKLSHKANQLKILVNQNYVVKSKLGLFFAFGIDGQGKPFSSPRSSMGHLLWAARNKTNDGQLDGVLYEDFVPHVVKRLLAPDLFVPEAGIRTLSTTSKYYNPHSYHNGSIWPHDNSLIAEGLENYGYFDQAQKVRGAILRAVSFFQTPIELFVYDQAYVEYMSPSGQKSCRNQAWSAAALMLSVSPIYASEALAKMSPTNKNRLLTLLKITPLIPEIIKKPVKNPMQAANNFYKLVSKLSEKQLQLLRAFTRNFPSN